MNCAQNKRMRKILRDTRRSDKDRRIFQNKFCRRVYPVRVGPSDIWNDGFYYRRETFREVARRIVRGES